MLPELERYLTPSRLFLIFWLAFLSGLALSAHITLALANPLRRHDRIFNLAEPFYLRDTRRLAS